ncbi:MAG: hypothetical protein Q8P17_01390 [bacterium]|nr:hypothetical protein [bacterium]
MKLESGEAPATGAPTAPTTPPTPKTGWRKWVDDNWWKVLSVIIVTATIVWGLKSTLGTSSDSKTWSSLLQPTPEWVWEFFRGYWFWIVLILAGLYFWFDGMTPAPAWAKGAKGMVVASAVLMVGAMAIHGIWGESSSSPKITRSEVPLASSPQSEWPPLFVPANGKKQIPILPGKRVTVAGYNFVLHTEYEGGRDCSGVCPDHGVVGVYVENKSATENTVVYAYTPIN